MHLYMYIEGINMYVYICKIYMWCMYVDPCNSQHLSGNCLLRKHSSSFLQSTKGKAVIDSLVG